MFSSLMFLVLEDWLTLIITIMDNFFPHWVKVCFDSFPLHSVSLLSKDVYYKCSHAPSLHFGSVENM